MDQTLIGIINATLSEPVLAQVVGLSTSRQIWKCLQSNFSQQSLANATHLRFQLFSISRAQRPSQNIYSIPSLLLTLLPPSTSMIPMMISSYQSFGVLDQIIRCLSWLSSTSQHCPSSRIFGHDFSPLSRISPSPHLATLQPTPTLPHQLRYSHLAGVGILLVEAATVVVVLVVEQTLRLLLSLAEATSVAVALVVVALVVAIEVVVACLPLRAFLDLTLQLSFNVRSAPDMVMVLPLPTTAIATRLSSRMIYRPLSQACRLLCQLIPTSIQTLEQPTI